MRILLIGNTGQVGWELERLLGTPRDLQGSDQQPESATGDALIALDYPAIDLTSPDSLLSAIHTHNPTIIINAAAYTAVDKAEEEERVAHAINAEAPGIMAAEMKKRGGALIHYSTDYVFDGAKDAPYTEEDEPNPLGAYGRTKRDGEEAIAAAGAPHIILRTSWIYDARGRNFLLTILRLAHEREELRIVDDQAGAPTWARDLAAATRKIIQGAGEINSVPVLLREHPGLYHLTSSGSTTWYEFAKAIVAQDPDREGQALKKLVPIPTEAYPTPAPRPKNSRLDCSKAREILGVELPPWEDSLANVMRELQGN